MDNIVKKLHQAFLSDYRNFLGTPSRSDSKKYSLYVDLYGGNTRDATQKERFNLREQLVQELFPKSSITSNECHLFLILGASGQGKTSFALALAKYYWDQMIIPVSTTSNKKVYFKVYDESVVLPVFICLSSVRENWGEILQTFLKKREIDEAYEIICKRKNVLLILDAYNEVIQNESESTNIWKCNKWGDQIGIKVVIFSRPECFTTISMRHQMLKYHKSGCQQELSAKEYFIQKYTKDNINQHVKQFVKFLNRLPFTIENLDNLFY